MGFAMGARRANLRDARWKIVSVSSADIRRLKALVQDSNMPQKHVWRAEIVRRGGRHERPPAPGSPPSRASSRPSPSAVSSAASSNPWSICRPPSTASSTITTPSQSPSNGSLTPKKSSKPSEACATNRSRESGHVGSWKTSNDREPRCRDPSDKTSGRQD